MDWFLFDNGRRHERVRLLFKFEAEEAIKVMWHQ